MKNLKNNLYTMPMKDHRLYENISGVVYTQAHKRIMGTLWLRIDNQVLTNLKNIIAEGVKDEQ